MKSVFVDTNVFLRFILSDVASQATRARKVFDEATRSRYKLYSSVIVFFEIYWVLKSSCGLVGVELVRKLKQILQLTVEFENYGLLVRAVDQMKKHNFDLEDAYNMNYARDLKVNEFETFDKKLQRRSKVTEEKYKTVG